MDGALKGQDELCGMKRGRRSKSDTLCWNERVKEAISRKKDVHKAMCENSTEENEKQRSMKNKAKKAVSRATRERRVRWGLLC